MIGAENRITPRAWARPTLRGLEPTSTNDTAVMMSALTSSAHHQSLNEYANDSDTRTAAVVSETTRMKFRALT